jgi:polyadenylation factor subunit 2
VTSVSFAPSDAKFVSSSDDQSLKLWDFARHEEEGTLEGHTW